MISEEQRQRRKLGVGASDSPIIMGFSGYKTPYQLYLEKCGLVEDDNEETERQYWGNQLEGVIRDHFARLNKVEVCVPDTIYHPEKPYMLANLDGYIAESNAVVEIKCADSFTRGEWGECGSDVVPMLYLVQVAHQCIVQNASMGYIGVLIGGNEYRQYEYHRDSELEGMILSAVDDFWLNNVQKRVDPASINIEDSRLKWKEVNEESKIVIDNTIADVLTEMTKYREIRKKLEKAEEKSKMQIMEYMKSCECLTDQAGKPLVTLKANARGTRVFLLK